MVRIRFMGVALFVASRASAAPPVKALDLRWLAPESCPDERAVTARVERQLGHSLASAQGKVAAGVVVSRRRGGAFRAEVETVVNGEVRDRTFDDDSCAALADAVALVLAFLIDPDAVAAQSQKSRNEATPSASTAADVAEPPPSLALPVAVPPLPAPPALPPPAPPARQPRLSAEAPNTSSPLRTSETDSARRPWLARAMIGIDSGSLPATTGFLGAALGRSFGAVSIELSGAWFFPRERLLASPETRGGQFDLRALGLAAGYRVISRRFEVVPRVGLELGSVYGSGFGVATSKQGKGLWLAAALGLAARYRLLGWLGAEAELSCAFPLSRPVYVLDNVGDVYRADSIGVRASSGLEAYF